MTFYVLTLFPDMVNDGLNTSIIGRAIAAEKINLNIINIRDFATNKHMKVDDYPYGGGAGMVMQAEHVYLAYCSVVKEICLKNDIPIPDFTNADVPFRCPNTRVIYVTPQGHTFNQRMAETFSKDENLIFLCGHYEGIDERVLEMIVTDYVSIGDYVLTGGELPAMVMIDTISRLVDGVLNNDDSAKYESFSANLLEYPQYTRPATFMGRKVPDVLLSGDHRKIEKWREEQSLLRTKERRPDLLESETVKELLQKSK